MNTPKKQNFLSYRNNRNRLPIALWLIIITAGALFLTNNIVSRTSLYSIVLTFVFCLTLFVNQQNKSNKSSRVVFDLMQMLCVLGLILCFGFWGFTYSIFFLIILIMAAFKYTNKEYVAIFALTVTSLGVIWQLQDVSVFGSSEIKNAFFLILINAFFAAAILSRILAKESLSMQSREKNLLEAQSLLEKENEDIHIVFNNMESAIIVFNSDNTVKFANDSIVDMFTIFKSKDNKDIDITKMMLIDQSGRKISLDELIAESDEKSYRSDLSIKVDDQVRNVNLTISKSLSDKGSYQGAMVSLHSLTADEVLEKTKNEFSSLASHEIRTPLTAMEGYIYLMLNSDKFQYNDLTKNYLNLLHESTTDLIKLANSILQMSKLDDGSIRVDIENVDLSDMVSKIANSEEKNAAAKGLKIECVLSKVPSIDTDKVKVTEVVTNLVENAIKFTNAGTIKLGLDQVGDCVTISVEDSGIGIPDESKSKIFDKFYQVESYDTRKNSGLGLGLFLSKSLARRIGGELSLDSTNEKGSVFTLSLPVKYPFPEDMKILKDKKLKEFIEGF